jgi:hypothetical protein
LFTVGHWCVCAWVFIIGTAEKKYAMNWLKYHHLKKENLGKTYLFCWYAIANIVSSVGSGDIFGTTDLERFFFVLLITFADVIFALAFGLLAELTANLR